MGSILQVRPIIALGIAKATNQQTQNIQNNIQPANIPWRKIEITNIDIQSLQALSTQNFRKQVPIFQCSIARGNQIMRKPVIMSCCAGSKFADKCNLLRALKVNPNRCPLCWSSIDKNSMIEDGICIKMAEMGIQILRKRIKIKFNQMDPQLREQFQLIVEQFFGMDYEI